MLEMQTAHAWIKEKGCFTSNAYVSYARLANIKQLSYSSEESTKFLTDGFPIIPLKSSL
jgi:uncharacterized membrane protein YobD (UPF0266 family)